MAGMARGSAGMPAHIWADAAVNVVTTERRDMPEAQTSCTVVHAFSCAAVTIPAVCMHVRKWPAQQEVFG